MLDKNIRVIQQEPKIKKTEMLLSWHFWKPIVFLLGAISIIAAAVAAINYFNLIDIILLLGLGALVLSTVYLIFYGLYSLGKMFYVEHLIILKNNYEELTNQKWDVDEPDKGQ